VISARSRGGGGGGPLLRKGGETCFKKLRRNFPKERKRGSLIHQSEKKEKGEERGVKKVGTTGRPRLRGIRLQGATGKRQYFRREGRWGGRTKPNKGKRRKIFLL